MGEGTCKFCGKPIWADTDGWRHECSGEEPNCNHVPEPREGRTLADFADARPYVLFKRPMHANPHGFTAGSDHLKEIRTSDWGGQHNVCADFPRLTREDLTATDWQEV